MLSSVCNNVLWNRGHSRMGRKAWNYHGTFTDFPRNFCDERMYQRMPYGRRSIRS